MIKHVATFGLGLMLAGIGSVMVFISLVKLGWRRHGASPTDLGFLHLPWIFEVDAPYWAAHLLNLAGLFIGLVATVGGLTLALLMMRHMLPSRN